MLTEVRRHHETEKREGQLPIINGSIYYRATYSQGRIYWGQATTIPKHSHLHSAPPRSRWGSFIVNLGNGVSAWKKGVHS